MSFLVKDVDTAVDELLVKRPTGFRNKHLAEALGVSRSRACRILASRVLSGELARKGEGPGKYVRGMSTGFTPGGVARGVRPETFWRMLADTCSSLAYVALRGLCLTDLRTRHQVRTLVRGLDFFQRFLVVDFEGVHSISRAAALELFLKTPWRMHISVEPINMELSVARAVWLVIRFGDAALDPR